MRVLVPVEVLEGESVPAGLIDLLSTADVTLLGYHVLPEQTPPDQARAQFEERAVGALEDVAEEFRMAGGDADHRLVFTHDRRQSVERVADDVDADALVFTGATGEVESLLVPLSGEVDVEGLLDFVVELVGDRDVGATLLYAAPDDASDSRLEEAEDRLDAAGVDVSGVRAAGNAFDALMDALPGHEVVVMAERAPSLSSLVFGEESERVAAASVGPVIVVRGPGDGDVEGGDGEEK
ncbi:MAG: universal stress protein [Halobacteriota archaeon]